MKKCPYCGEQIQDDAVKCRYCGEWLGNTNDRIKKNVILNFLGGIKQKVNKYVVISIVSIIVLLTGAYFYKSFTYDANIKDFKTNTAKLFYASAFITTEFHKNWQHSIFDNYKYFNTLTGDFAESSKIGEDEWEYCDDFNDVLQLQAEFYRKSGVYHYIDSLYGVSKDYMGKLTPAPSSYSDKFESWKAMFQNAEGLYRQAKSPRGSIRSFSDEINDLMENFNFSLGQSNLEGYSIEDSIDSIKMDAIIELSFRKTNFAVKILKDQKIENEKKIGENKKWMERNAKNKGVITDPCGIQYKVIRKGTGVIPKEDSQVTVHYEGRLIDGTVFDSSYQRNETATLNVSAVIKGWQHILTKMPVGSMWEVYIPAELGYGERGAGTIKPYSILIFKIELIKCKN